MGDLADRVSEVRQWADFRIRHCREQETKFTQHWVATSKGHGPPQALVEAWAERRALQAVLEMLKP